MNGESSLKACGIGRRKAGAEEWLLRHVCLEVRPGDRLSLVGPTGSGKTLLLRALALLDPLEEGTGLEGPGGPGRGRPDVSPGRRLPPPATRAL